MSSKAPLRGLGAVLALFTPAAFAHTGAGDTSALTHGLTHPFLGADHVLAMVAVGLWAAQRGGRALWSAPLMFVAAMAIAAALAVQGASLPLVEFGVAGSVLVFGLLMLAGRQVSPALGLAVIAAFAVFHGQAHGNEIPMAPDALGYGLGFALSTAALHASGVAAGLAARAVSAERWWRTAGVVLMGSGAYLLGTI